MPLSRVICVTHYTGFPFGSASFTELLCWYGTVLSALPQFTCRNSVALCRLWLGVKRLVPLLWQTLSSPCKHLDYAASCILSWGPSIEYVTLFLTNFDPPPPVTLCHTSRTPLKYVTSETPPPKDNQASICASELCKERSYKYRITAVLHCIVKKN